MNNKLRYSALAAATLVVIALVASVLAVTSAKAATYYYVDCSAGSNGNGSQASPWNTLTSVNAPTFVAGDQILFKRGTTCAGVLWPKGSGTSGTPIVVSAYGTGSLPIINGGTNEEAIKLYNQEYWEFSNIETTGGTRYGFFADGNGTAILHHIYITNSAFHDVTGGTMNLKSTGLVVFGYDFTQEFDDVLIDGVTAHDTTMWAGIIIQGKGWKWQTTRSNGVVIRNSTAYNTYGDGIVAYSSQNVLLEHNLAYHTGVEATQTIGTPNAIWTWDCSYCTVQYNEAYDNHSPGVDGGAFDIDTYSSNTTVQYNYGHDNDTYCVAIFASDGTVSYSTIRYNICSNNARDASQATDRSSEIYIAVWQSGSGGGVLTNTLVHNNTFYWNPANATLHYAIAAYDLYNGTGFSGTNRIWNNIIYAANPNMLKMGINTNVTLDYNLYWYAGGSPKFVWGSKTYTSFSAYQTGSGQDAHGMFVNPLLNDPTYHSNGFPVTSFTLQSGSPAINAGADICSGIGGCSMGSQDFFGNAIPNGAYDIGAYESGGAPQPTATNTPIPSPTNTPGGPTPTPTNTPVPPTPTVTNTPGGTVMHVHDLYTTDASGNPKTVFIAGTNTVYWRVKIVDASGNPVSGAAVTTQVLKPGGSQWVAPTATTGADGWALFSKSNPKNSAKGVYTINVTNVTKSGWTYDSNANLKTSTTFTIQ